MRGVFAENLVERERGVQETRELLRRPLKLDESDETTSGAVRGSVAVGAPARLLEDDAKGGGDLLRVASHALRHDFHDVVLADDAVTVEVVQGERELEPRLLLRERARGAHLVQGRSHTDAGVDVRERAEEILERAAWQQGMKALGEDAALASRRGEERVQSDVTLGAAEDVRQRPNRVRARAAQRGFQRVRERAGLVPGERVLGRPVRRGAGFNRPRRCLSRGGIVVVTTKRHRLASSSERSRGWGEGPEDAPGQ